MGKSEKRILGWEPAEFHEYHYDDEGRVASVTVTREVEWDDESRDDMLALAHYEAGICECGFHSSLTSDPSNFFTIEQSRCLVCKGAAVHSRIQQAADDEEIARMGEDPPPDRVRPDDGRRTYLRPMTSDEAQAARARQALLQR